MSTTKISVTIADADLRWLRRRAKRLHGGNLSAAVAEGARLVRKQEALRAFLEGEGVPVLSDTELAEVQSEWRGAEIPPARKKRRAP